MDSLREICEEYNVTIFDALDLYYMFGYDWLPDNNKALCELRKVYKKAQLPYLKMEATGEPESVLVSSAQELLGYKDGPKEYYISYSLSHFVNIEELCESPVKDKLALTASIAYHLLSMGETYQTITLMPVSVFESFTDKMTCQEFLSYYSLIVHTKQEKTVDFMEACANRDVSGVEINVIEYMSHSVRHEKKQENIETAKTVGKIGAKVGYGIGMHFVTKAAAPIAGPVTIIVAVCAGVDLLAVIVGLFCGWSFTWFFGALGAAGLCYVVWSWWVEAVSHPVRTLLCIWTGIPATVICVGCFVVNIVKAIAGAFA